MEKYDKLEDVGKGKQNAFLDWFQIGSFGLVSKIKRKSDGQILVWKELNYGKMNEKEKS